MIKNNYLSFVAVVDLMKGIETTTFSRIACTVRGSQQYSLCFNCITRHTAAVVCVC